MNALFSFLLLFLAIIYWGFRVIVCLMATMQLEYFTVPYNTTFEIVMLLHVWFLLLKEILLDQQYI